MTVSTPPPSFPAPAPSGEPGFLAATRAAYDSVAVSYAALLADALAANPHERAALGLYAELLCTAGPTEGTGSTEGARPAEGAKSTGSSIGGARSSGSAGSAERAESGRSRPRVAEIGCGPGRITAHLAGLGLDVHGIDLSPAMIAEARRRHPRLAFGVGSMTALDLPSASLDGLAAWYSVIHVPPSRHRAVYAGFHRVLRPGGLLLLGFQAGDERRRITEAYGHTGLALDAYRLRPERVEQDLTACGFALVSRTVREAAGAERNEQAYLIARAIEH